MACDQFIASFLSQSCNGGNQYSMVSDALSCVKHTIIIQNLERMILERMKLT